MKQISVKQINDILAQKMNVFAYNATLGKPEDEQKNISKVEAVKEIQNTLFEQLGVVTFDEFMQEFLKLGNTPLAYYNWNNFGAKDFQLTQKVNGFQINDSLGAPVLFIDNDKKVDFFGENLNMVQVFYAKRNMRLIRPIFLTEIGDSEFNLSL